jgi:hypothetical protein
MEASYNLSFAQIKKIVQVPMSYTFYNRNLQL